MTERRPTKSDVARQLEKANELADDADLLDKVEALPQDEREQMMETLEMYSGPIPHPRILKGYEELYRGSAREIIENGIEESRHRRNLESRRQDRRGHLAWATLIGITIITALFIAGSFYLILNDHEIIGSIFGGGSFIALIGSWMDQVPMLTAKDDISNNVGDGTNNKD